MVGETFAFQAEINQLLSLIINTFYSNKDIFLRELTSNASDALDKARYKMLSEGGVVQGEELCIRVWANEEKGELVIEDNGIGMTRDELVKNLGTIAHSGTRGFMEALSAGPDMSLIGQFGVGFYSAFLVADKVKVVSMAHGSEEAWVWESNASGSFTVAPGDNESIPKRGTQIYLTLKADLKEYLDPNRVKEIITKHNQYMGYPIYVKEAEAEAEAEAEDGLVDTVHETPKKVDRWYHVNKQAPTWTRKPEDVSHEEYATFYKAISGDWEEHLAVKHFAAEGQVEFKAVLFVPPRAPFDMFTGGTSKKLNNIKLYVRKVLIMDETNDLVPEYLQFLKGVVDSDDLPLNVSREMLQKNNIMKVIKKNLVKKSLDLLSEMAEGDAEKWKRFYDAFSKNIKLGIIEDAKSRDRLKELLRFSSSRGEEGALVSLKDYVGRMKEDQKGIYFVTGETLAGAKGMPCIEGLVKRGVEVLFLTDPIDEYVVQHVLDYNGKSLVNCSKEGFVLDDKGKEDGDQKSWEATCKRITEALNDRVKAVRVSNVLISRPCALISDQYGWTANMERIMRAQALRSGADAFSYMAGMKKVMDINPDHPVLHAIKEKVANEGDTPDRALNNVIEMMYETALIESGFPMEDPSNYCGKIYRLIQLGLAGEVEEPEKCDEVPVTPVAEEAHDSTMEEVD